MEDSRIIAAHELLRNVGCRAEADTDDVEGVVTGLLAYAEERLKVNIGLLAAQKQTPVESTTTLAETPTADLLAELARRLEDKQ